MIFGLAGVAGRFATKLLIPQLPSVKRICFAIELSPAYVDVAVRRWQAFTGKKVVRLCDEREFDALAAQLPASEA
jgi:hypothetical protein